MRVKDEFEGATAKPRLWRRLWKLSRDDLLETKVLFMDWSSDPSTCMIQIGSLVREVGAGRPEDLYRGIEKEFELEDIYLRKKEGNVVTHETDSVGKDFTVYEYVDRRK
jgi:hypothetical protein